MTNHFLKNLAAQRFLFVNGTNGSGSSSGSGGPKPPQGPVENEYAEYDQPKKPASNNADTDHQEIDDVMSGTHSNISELYEIADQAAEVLKNKTIDPRLAENVASLVNQIGAVIEKDKKLPHPLAQYVDSILKRGNITERDAELLKRLDNTIPSFKEDYKKILKKIGKRLNTAEVTGLDKALNKEAQYIAQIKEIDDEAEELLHQWRNIFGKFSDNVMDQAYREDAVKSAAKTMGLPLSLNKKFVFYHNGRKASLEITDLSFEELDSLDKDPFGNPLPASRSSKFTSGPDKKETNDPVLKLKIVYLDHDDPEIPDTTYGKMSLSGFQKWSEDIDLREDLATTSDLEQVLGMNNIKAGSQFEYRKDVDAADPSDALDVTVTIKEIKDGKDKNGAPTKILVLDKKIITKTAKEGQEEKYEVTLAEFAKWARRNEAVMPYATLEDVNNALVQHNELLNKKYGRPANQFPPAEAKSGEVLQYDDGTGRKFAIKAANDNEIEFDDGTKMTPTAFMRWVKNNEVEKFDPHAEAEKATHHLEGEEKEKESKKELEKAKHDLEEMRKKLEEHNGHGDVPHDEVVQKIAEHNHPYDPSKFSSSYLRRLWMNTSFISIDGLIEMGKKISEFIKRKYKRRTEGSIGTVGEKMFMGLWNELGADFKGIAQHAENEEVSHHAHHYETMGIETVRHELHIAPTKDILKAAIQVLAKKGQMRWDDHAFWDRMNHFAGGSLSEVDKTTGKMKPMWINESNYMDGIEKYLDKWFGNDTFREFRNSQDSSFKSIKNNFTDNAKRLETDPEGNGGLRFALQNMMYKHLQGEYVNPAQFESYLDFTITAGKLSMEDKMMFMLLGVGAEAKGAHGHAGMTLLPIERIAELEGDRLNNLPILDYFTSRTFPQFDYHGHPKIDPTTGKQAQGYVQIWHIKKIIKEYIEDPLGGDIKSLTEPGKINPGKTKLDIFIRDIQSWDPRARQRVEKSASDTTRWDHDDCDIFVPLLGEESVRQAVQKQGGARQAISNQGLQNAYVGFNNFTYLTIDRLKRNIDEAKEKPGSTEVKESTQETVERMSHLLKVFIRLDAYLDKRSEHSATLTRFGDREYDALAVNDTSRTVRTFVEEQRAFIGGLAKKWGMGQLWAQCISKAGGEYPNPDFAKKQENAIADFNKQLGAMMQRVYEAKGAEGLLKDFQDVQEENSKKTGSEDISLDIKGQLSKPVTKSEARKEATTSSKYEDGVLKGKVEEINYLNNRIAATENKSIAEIKAHREARLDQLIKKIQKGDYGNINKEDDIEILDREISRLKQDLDKKKQGEEDKNSEAEKKKKAEATAKAKADEEEEAVIAAKRKEEAERG